VNAENRWQRISDGLGQAWAIALKDIRIYYSSPPMIMFGLLMPFLMFFSFSVTRNISPNQGMARLLAITAFFTASSAGPVILPLEHKAKTYDRLLVAPMPLSVLLLGKALVGAFFAVLVSLLPLVAAQAVLGAAPASLLLTLGAVVLSAFVFSVLGLLFAAWPSSSPGSIMMPSTLIRWPLMFISGIFVPLHDMTTWTRVLSYISPLTYSQDLMNYAVLGRGDQSIALDLLALAITCVILIVLLAWFHRVRRKWGV
jgi:ABC-2 type transport system permease protein